MRERGLESHDRVPASVKREFKHQITSELMRETMPTLRNVVVCIDTEAMRFMVLAAGKGASGIKLRVERLLAMAAGINPDDPDANLPHAAPLGRMAQTAAAFPYASFPDGVDASFMPDLLQHMAENEELHVEGIMPFWVSRGDKVTLGTSDRGRLSASGDEEASRVLDERIDDDGVFVKKIAMEVGDEHGSWSFMMDNDAQIHRVSMPDMSDESGQDSAESDVALRADSCWRAVEIQQAIIHAYLSTVVRGLLSETPQLFPLGDETVSVRWSRPGEPVPSQGSEEFMGPGELFRHANFVGVKTVRDEAKDESRAAEDRAPPSDPAHHWRARFGELAARTLHDIAKNMEDSDLDAVLSLARESTLRRSQVLAFGADEGDLGFLLVQLLEEAGVEFFPDAVHEVPPDEVTLSEPVDRDNPPQELLAPAPDDSETRSESNDVAHGGTPRRPEWATQEDVDRCMDVLERHLKPGRSPASTLTTHLTMGYQKAGAMCDYLRACGIIGEWGKRSRKPKVSE
jgi:hypothetical protein